MQRVFRLLTPGLLLLLCHCGGPASLRAARAGRIAGLDKIVADDVKRGVLGASDAVAVARAVGRVEVAQASGVDAPSRIRDFQGCARPLEGALTRRLKKGDASAAAAATVLVDAGLEHPGEFARWATEAPDGPRAALRGPGARGLVKPRDAAQRRALMGDADQEVRAGALHAAADAADPDDTDAVLEAARVDPYPAARAHAIRAAGAIGGERVVLALRDLWQTADDATREVIASAWANPASLDAGGRRELAWAADTQKGKGALAAAFSLVLAGGDGAPQAASVIERAIQGGSAEERRLAIGAAPLRLTALRDAVIKAVDDKDATVALAAAARRLELAPAAGGAPVGERAGLVAKLMEMASGGHADEAPAAKIALARAGARQVLPLLEKDATADEARVRRAAGGALAAMKEFPRAAVLAGDSDVGVRAAVACAILEAAR